MSFDIGEFFRRIFTPPGTGGLEAQTQIGVTIARQQADNALSAQRDATAAIAAAAIPPLDSEEIRTATEDRLRRNIARGTFMDNFNTAPMAPQPVNFKQLFGGST